MPSVMEDGVREAVGGRGLSCNKGVWIKYRKIYAIEDRIDKLLQQSGISFVNTRTAVLPT
jgi:hypothetical protein